MIKVTIDQRTGKATIEVSGVQGKSCEDLSRDLEKMMGITSSKSRTAEYDAQGAVNQQVRRGAI